MPKVTQKNYEAIKIYRQKELIFELKGKVQTLENLLAVAKAALSDCREMAKQIQMEACKNELSHDLMLRIDMAYECMNVIKHNTQDLL